MFLMVLVYLVNVNKRTQQAHRANSRAETMTKLEKFAERMHQIPRKTQKCEVYGSTSVIVDQRHAKNIFWRIDPCAKGCDIYHAINILQDRLDDDADR